MFAGHATGEWARSGTSAYAKLPNVLEEVEVKEEETRSTRQAVSASSRGRVPRKKRSTSADEKLNDYIATIADSVAKVANAIEGTSRAAEETKMFTQLMMELSSIDGFSEEEVDKIYLTSSKEPTMIRSFLSRPHESKARWMREELGK